MRVSPRSGGGKGTVRPAFLRSAFCSGFTSLGIRYYSSSCSSNFPVGINGSLRHGDGEAGVLGPVQQPRADPGLESQRTGYPNSSVDLSGLHGHALLNIIVLSNWVRIYY